QIEHFYTHYKDLEEGKWVKLRGWRDKEAAREAILKSVENYKK
ncbi:MAG: inorganic diphosphatase, partial [Pseudomonadales bacterium]